MKFPVYLFAIAACVCISTCFSQEAFAQDNYFRYFEVSSTALSAQKLKSFEEVMERNDNYSLHQFCSEQQRMVIAVSAQYAKRIDDIKFELEGYVKKSFRTKEPITIATIPATKRDQNCQ